MTIRSVPAAASLLQTLFPELPPAVAESVYLDIMGMSYKMAAIHRIKRNDQESSVSQHRKNLSFAAMTLSDGNLVNMRIVVQMRLFTELFLKLERIEALVAKEPV